MIVVEISSFIGRFHPLVVHIPIGFLSLALLLEIPFFKKKFLVNSLLWLLSFVTSILAVVLGLLLAQSGHYIDAQLSLHKWSGILLVILCGMGWIARIPNFKINPLLQKINNGLVLFTLLFVGHNGGGLTHGESYLYERAPEWIKTQLVPTEENRVFKNIPIDSIYVYRDLIQPLFDSKCASCHNDQINQGGLNLTSAQELFKGGTSGAGLVQKDLSRSLVYTRIIKPQSDLKFMPPAGIPMTYSEIQLLEWWIMEGAPIEVPLAAQTIPQEIQSLLLKNYTLDARTKPWFEKVKLTPLTEKDLNRLEQNQLRWRKLSEENELLDIRLQGDQITEEAIAVLNDYAPYITWLNLSNTKLENNSLKVIAKMENLTRLNLQKSNLSKINLSPLTSLNHIEILNLHSTQVDQDIFEIVKQLPSLKKLYLWNTAVTNQQIIAQQNFFPALELIGGLE